MDVIILANHSKSTYLFDYLQTSVAKPYNKISFLFSITLMFLLAKQNTNSIILEHTVFT